MDCQFDAVSRHVTSDITTTDTPSEASILVIVGPRKLSRRKGKGKASIVVWIGRCELGAELECRDMICEAMGDRSLVVHCNADATKSEIDAIEARCKEKGYWRFGGFYSGVAIAECQDILRRME